MYLRNISLLYAVYLHLFLKILRIKTVVVIDIRFSWMNYIYKNKPSHLITYNNYLCHYAKTIIDSN